MTPLSAYFLGLLTLPACFAFCVVLESYKSWKWDQRYKKAYAKFTMEFDLLPTKELEKIRAKWKIEDCNRDLWTTPIQWESEKNRYFAMQWQYGETKEI